jgi:hypothetical protein
MLPGAVKYGAIWDEFKGAIYKGVNFKSRFRELCELYQITDEGMAKLEGMFKAYKALELQVEPGGEVQKHFEFVHDGYLTHGYIDCAYDNYFIEDKCSARPEIFRNLFAITPQAAVYHSSNPKYKYCIYQVIRFPAQRFRSGRNSDESPQEFKNRVFRDCIERPGHYFLGFDRKKRVYGIKFWRSEFPLREVQENYGQVFRDILRAAQEKAFYPNYLGCHAPSVCSYLSICSTGCVSEEIYQKRKEE